MALATELMGVGLPQEQASLIGQGNLTAITAAGVASTTATLISGSQIAVTSAAGATGVIMQGTSTLTRLFFIRNLSTSTAPLNVYPPSGGSINGAAANAAIVVPIGQSVLIFCQVQSAASVWVAYSTPGGGVTPQNGQTISARTIAIGDLVPAASTDFNDSTPVATEVYIGEILVPANCTVTGVAPFHGSVASGNMKVGLADSQGNVLATSASTAVTGTDSYQLIPFTATINLLPGTYYILGIYDNGTARYNSPILGVFGASKQTGQVYATGFTTIVPPTTFTTNLSLIASLY